MKLNVKPETAEALEHLASARGLSVDEYLDRLVREELAEAREGEPDAASGMVWENGLYVYRTGKPLPQSSVDGAIRLIREERSRQILGKRS